MLIGLIILNNGTSEYGYCSSTDFVPWQVEYSWPHFYTQRGHIADSGTGWTEMFPPQYVKRRTGLRGLRAPPPEKATSECKGSMLDCHWFLFCECEVWHSAFRCDSMLQYPCDSNQSPSAEDETLLPNTIRFVSGGSPRCKRLFLIPSTITGRSVTQIHSHDEKEEEDDDELLERLQQQQQRHWQLQYKHEKA